MADKYHSIHTGQAIDSAVTKALNPSTTFNSEDAGKLADAKAVGELVNAEKERAEATYLPYDGYSQLARVGEADVADNLTPYSSDSGTSQNTPFIDQGTACANGEEQADTGSYCQLKEKRGNTVVVNQIVENGNFESSAGWSGTYGSISVSNNKLTFTRTNINNSARISRPISIIAGHKYFFTETVTPNAECTFRCAVKRVGAMAIMPIMLSSVVSANTKTTFIRLFTADYDGELLYLYNADESMAGEVGDTVIYEKAFMVDLTLWFGSNDKIPTHLLNHPEDFFRYYQGSLAYNAGALTDCNGRYLKTTGRNVWDEQWELGTINTTGNNASATSQIRSKNYVPVVPNGQIYFYLGANRIGRICWYDSNKNFISVYYPPANQVMNVPSDARWMRFVIGTGEIPITTYNHDITISLYYEGESGYDQYYPYEELANIDTGNEPLLAFDYKTPDGVIHRNTGRVDLGTLEWVYETSLNGFRSASLVGTIKPPSLNSDAPNIACEKYVPTVWTTTADKAIYVYPASLSGRGAILIYDSTAGTDAETFKAAMSGVYLEYELATPTTEQGTPFPENVAIDDFGTMAFDCPNGVPQGNTVFYPVDYKAEFDTLHNITEGDMHKIALKGELASGDPDTIKGVVDAYNALYAINQENMGGTLRHILADKANIDFANTAYIDLGERSWQKFETVELGVYYGFDLPERKSGSLNIVASKYATYSSTGVSGMPDKYITSGTGNTTVYLKDSSYTDATTLKTALKGILLAYEKATT